MDTSTSVQRCTSLAAGTRLLASFSFSSTSVAIKTTAEMASAIDSKNLSNVRRYIPDAGRRTHPSLRWQLLRTWFFFFSSSAMHGRIAAVAKHEMGRSLIFTRGELSADLGFNSLPMTPELDYHSE